MKVGDYVRYKCENCIYIGKIKFISEVMGCEETLQLDIDDCMEEILKEDIIKSSPNIIDLIEVGDYVNGYKVDGLDLGTTGEKIRLHTDSYDNLDFNNNEIKLIVTKEQFESMEYRIINGGTNGK